MSIVDVRFDVEKRRDRERGSVLVLVLWLLLIVGLAALGLARSARVSASLSFGQVESVQARWLARAGVEQAIAVLADDITPYDGPDDLWFDEPGRFEDVELATGFTFRVTAPSLENALDAGQPRFGLDDEASRVLLTPGRGGQLRRLPDITEAQADAVLDWMDGNEEARAGGAERGHYAQLDFPYLIRNAPMRTHREWLLVKGMMPGDFFGEDANLNGVLDRNENDGDQSSPVDNGDRRLDTGLAALTTVYSYERNATALGTPRVNLKETDADTLSNTFRITPGLAEAVVEEGQNADTLFDLVGTRGEQADQGDDQTNEVTVRWLATNWDSLTLEADERLPGKLNVNTARAAALETVPGMTPELAQSIVDQRGSQGAYTSVGQLYLREVLTEEQFEATADFLTVRSNVFRILSEGRTPSGTRHQVAVIVDRGGLSPVVLDWRQP